MSNAGPSNSSKFNSSSTPHPPKAPSESSDPNVFDFFQEDDAPGQGNPQTRKIESLPHFDLTENPTYLMQFCADGFVWNEEVLLSPPFSSSFQSSNSVPSSMSSHSFSQRMSESAESRVFPSMLAEKLRRQRIARETLVAEIHIKD